MKRIACLFALLLGATAARDHIASNGFLSATVSGDTVTGAIEVAVRDVELAVGVDANRDGKVTWGELRRNESQLDAYVQQHLGLSAHGRACVIALQALEVNDRVDGSYAWLPYTARCPVAIT